MRVAAVGIVALLLLAGCAGKAPPKKADPVQNADFSNLDLAATATTGVIRGIVVDEAIRPLPGVNVTVRGSDDKDLKATTTPDGLFGFDDLQPGTYFVQASKASYLPAQQSVEVVAGVKDPPIAKVLLAVDPANKPYFDALVFDGFLECGVTTPPVGVAVCFAAGTPNEKTQVTYTISRRPQWVQTEMIWQSTQALGDELSLMYSYSGGCGLFCDHEVSGTSPLLLQANQTVIDTIGLGNGTDLYIRVFNSDLDQTDLGLDSVCTPVPDPVLHNIWCLANGVGLTLEQKFTHYTHVFYGYTPPEDWRFSSGTDVPQPPQ